MPAQRNRRAGVEDLWTKAGPNGRRVNSARHGTGKRWRARYTDDHGREITRAFARKTDAQRFIDEITASVVTGTYVDPGAGRVTFASYYAEWSKRQVWVAGTERAMSLAAGSVPFADVPLSRIRRSHVEQWVKAMQTANRGATPDGTAKPPGLAPGTISTRFNNVRAVFTAAVKDRAISSNPTDDVRLPRLRKAEAAMAIPTGDQVSDILGATYPHWRAFVAVCAFAGLRLGEAAALQVGDIDFLRRRLRVSRQVQRSNGQQPEVRAPKYGSERTVFVPDGLLELLSEHIADWAAGTDPNRWLFLGDGTMPPHQNTVGHWYRQARERAGHPDVRLHDLRHFYASGLIAAGCDVVTVQRAMGHASATVTLSTYAHLWPDAEDRTRAAAQAMFASLRPAAYQLRTGDPS